MIHKQNILHSVYPQKGTVRLKICYVGSVFPRSNDDTEVPWLRKTVSLLIEQGHEITVFVPSFRGLKSHIIDGITVKRFRYFPARWEDLTHDEGGPNKIHKLHYKIITIFYLLSGSIQLALLHRKKKFDILHVHWPFPHGILSTFAMMFHKTKIILNFHGACLLLAQRFPYVRWFLKYFIEKADAVIVNSSFTGKKVTDIYNRPIHVIPYGTTVVPKTSEHKAVPGRHIFSVGRMIERKGFKYLIDAMPQVVREFPDATLTIAGGGPVREQLVQQVNTLQLQKNVILPGKVSAEELERLFSQGDMFILPAIIDKNGDTEGLGVVLIEAMTYKMPVIASNVGGIPDVIIPGKSGILVEQKNPSMLADAIIDLLRNPKKMQDIGEMGYAFISKEFSWKKVIGEIESLYEEVIRES
jgi:glycosyltransferase involved in cell wall biosynthesis